MRLLSDMQLAVAALQALDAGFVHHPCVAGGDVAALLQPLLAAPLAAVDALLRTAMRMQGPAAAAAPGSPRGALLGTVCGMDGIPALSPSQRGERPRPLIFPALPSCPPPHPSCP